MSTVQLTPAFIMYIGGARLQVEQEMLVKDLIVHDRLNAPSSFSCTMSIPGGKWSDFETFEEGFGIKIHMGYKDNVEEIFDGEITAIEPSFDTSGNVNLTLKGFDKIHRLKRGKKNVSFTKKKDSDVVKEIASAIQLSAKTDTLGSQQEFILQKNLSDFDYLRQLGRKHNSSLWSDKGSLMFKKLENIQESDVVLEWGKTLINFRPRASGMGMPTEMEVRGWDPAKFEPVVGTAKAGDITVKIGGSNLGLKLAEKNFGAAKASYVDESIIDIKGAEEAAVNILTDISLNYITGSGKCEGNPKILGATIISIQGVGDSFSGKYLVESAKHHLNPHLGYQTSFSVKRNACP